MDLRQVVSRVAPFFRTHTPEFYDFAITQLSSPTSRTLRSIHRWPAERALIAGNAPLFAVNLGARSGLGAMLSAAVGVLAYCDEQKLIPRLIFTNPFYAVTPGEDWLDRLFKRRGALLPGPEESLLPRERYVLKSINLDRRIRPVYARLTLERAHDLFLASLQVRREFHEETDAFCREHGVGADTIGVHYRGTDKRLEASRVAWDDIAESIDAHLEYQSNLFVATDEPEFLQFMQGRFGAARVVDLACREVFSGRPAHSTAGDPVVKASEAIRTILALSRCGLLIRTRSHLSGWAKIFEPSLPCIVFGTMHGNPSVVFPEHLIETESVPAARV